MLSFAVDGAARLVFEAGPTADVMSGTEGESDGTARGCSDAEAESRTGSGTCSSLVTELER